MVHFFFPHLMKFVTRGLSYSLSYAVRRDFPPDSVVRVSYLPAVTSDCQRQMHRASIVAQYYKICALRKASIFQLFGVARWSM